MSLEGLVRCLFTIIGEAIKHHLFSAFAIITLRAELLLCGDVCTRAKTDELPWLRCTGTWSGPRKLCYQNPTHSALSSIQGLPMPFMRSLYWIPRHCSSIRQEWAGQPTRNVVIITWSAVRAGSIIQISPQTLKISDLGVFSPPSFSKDNHRNVDPFGWGKKKLKSKKKKKEKAPNNTSKHLERRLLWMVVVASQLRLGCVLQKEISCVPSECDACVLWTAGSRLSLSLPMNGAGNCEASLMVWDGQKGRKVGTAVVLLRHSHRLEKRESEARLGWCKSTIPVAAELEM